MKKIALLISATLAASGSQAYISYFSGSLTDATARSSFAAGTLMPGFAYGDFGLLLDTSGAFLSSGQLSLDSYQIGTSGLFGSHTNTYSNMVFNLSSASGSLVDTDYMGTGTWLVKYDFGFSNSNMTWSTAMTAPSSAVRNSNGSYLSNPANGYISTESGSIACTGSCSIWGSNSLGIEGLSVMLYLDPTNSFATLGANIQIQEIAGASGSLHYTINGNAQDTMCLDCNKWIGLSGSWHDGSNWSGGEAPGTTSPVELAQIDNVNRVVTYSTGTSPQLSQLLVNSTGSGTMTLNQTGGELLVENENIGLDGNGHFIQDAGTHIVTKLDIGSSVNDNYDSGGGIGGSGSYTLYDGELIVTDESLGLNASAGEFIQNGGTHTITDTLLLGSGYQHEETTWYSYCDYDPYTGEEYCDSYSYTDYYTHEGSATYTLNDGTLNVNNITQGQFSNSKLVINGGTLNLTGSSINVDTFELGSAANSNGSFTLENGKSLYTYNLVLGSNSNNGTGNLTQNGGTNTTSYLTLNRGPYTQNGGSNKSYYSLSINNGSSYIQNNGTNETGSLYLNNGSYIQNGGTNKASSIDVKNGGSYLLNAGSLATTYAIKNAGQFIIGAGASVTGNGSQGFVQTAGLTRVDGLLQQSKVIIQGGTLQGNGTIDSNVTVTGGTIQAGNSIGELTIDGDFTLNGGTLLMEIGGLGEGEFDLLTVTGNINLFSGELAFNFVDGFSAQAGDEWLFLAGAFSGSLEGLVFSYNGIPQGLNFIVSTTSNGLKLSAVQAVPVPAAAWLMGTSLLGLAGIARRKKS